MLTSDSVLLMSIKDCVYKMRPFMSAFSFLFFLNLFLELCYDLRLANLLSVEK